MFANEPVAELVDNVTVSPDTTPDKAADVFTNVAAEVPSYSLFDAVIFVIESAFAVMSAVVGG